MPSHIEAWGKGKISSTDLVHHGFFWHSFWLKKYCTRTLFVLITEFLACPCIWCPRQYLIRLTFVLVPLQPLCHPHLGRLRSVHSGAQARNLGSSVAPLLSITHLSILPPSISQVYPPFSISFATTSPQWGPPLWAPFGRQEQLLGLPCRLCCALQHSCQCCQQTQ